MPRKVLGVVCAAALVAVGGAVFASPLVQASQVLSMVSDHLESIHVETRDSEFGLLIADLILRPNPEYRLLSDGQPYEIGVTGRLYSRAVGSPRWVVGQWSGPEPGPVRPHEDERHLLWWSGLTGPRVVNADAASWQVQGSYRGMPVNVWISKQGCPLRATIHWPAVPVHGPTSPYDVHYTYSSCNQLAVISAPAADLLRGPPLATVGGVGQRLTLDGSAVTVTSSTLSQQAPASLPAPTLGKVYLVVDVSIENSARTTLPFQLAAEGPGLTLMAEWSPAGSHTLATKGELAPGQAVQGRLATLVPATGTGYSLRASIDRDNATIQLGAPAAPIALSANIGQAVRVHSVVITVMSVNFHAAPSTLTGDEMRPGDRVVAVYVHLQMDAVPAREFEIQVGGKHYWDMTGQLVGTSPTDRELRFAVPETATGLVFVAHFNQDTLSVPLGA